jgi:hypothetical protein
MRLTRAAELLQQGMSVEFAPTGNSMTPLIMSGQWVRVEPLPAAADLNVGDIVLAKVKANLYLHKVSAIEGRRVQISNNHGRINGWTMRNRVYGRVV